MKPPAVPPATCASYRDVCLVAILIVGVCGFALSPTLYLIFRALRWERALLLVEAAFFPAFLLFATAALLVYRRSRSRYHHWHNGA